MGVWKAVAVPGKPMTYLLHRDGGEELGMLSFLDAAGCPPRQADAVADSLTELDREVAAADEARYLAKGWRSGEEYAVEYDVTKLVVDDEPLVVRQAVRAAFAACRRGYPMTPLEMDSWQIEVQSVIAAHAEAVAA